MRWLSPLAATALLLTLTSASHATSASPAADFANYAAQCEQLVGKIEPFDCGDGAIVPITVNGIEPKPGEYRKGMTCDRPALLDYGPESDGQCIPYSRLLDLSRPGVQISAMCRQKNIRTADSRQYDEIDIIAHNPATGATCWFAAHGDGTNPVDGRHVPSPSGTDGPAYWDPLPAVLAEGCGSCHDNDPAMYSPWVGQKWELMPTNPFGPYYHVGGEFGFAAWPTKHMAPRDNTCTGCHRIGIRETCGALAETATGRTIPAGADDYAKTFPGSHSMPPGHELIHDAWNAIHQASVDKLVSCCKNPAEAGCNIQQIPSFSAR